MKKILGYFLFFILVTTSYLNCSPNHSEDGNSNESSDNLGITLPPGFKIDIYADNVKGARSMALSPSGVLR